LYKFLGDIEHSVGSADDAYPDVGEIGVEDVGAVIVAKGWLVHECGLSAEDVPELSDVLAHATVGDARARKNYSGEGQHAVATENSPTRRAVQLFGGFGADLAYSA